MERSRTVSNLLSHSKSQVSESADVCHKVHVMRFNVGSTFEARVCKFEETLDQVLNDLTATDGDKAQLATELDAY